MFTPQGDLIRQAFERHEYGDNSILVAEVNRFPVGQMWIDLAKRVHDSIGILWALRVMPPFQNLGVGTRLTTAADDVLKHNGFVIAEIGVEKDNLDQDYNFFIYRYNQRTLDQIKAEWQFVEYLAAHGIPVAPAIPTEKGDYGLEFSVPEGTRYGVLTTFVEGQHLRRRSGVEAVKTYGRLIARIHTLADAMPFSLTRPANDIEQIANRSIAAFSAAVPDCPEDAAYLQQCIGVPAMNVDHWGSAYLHAFLDQSLGQLRRKDQSHSLTRLCTSGRVTNGI